MVTARAAPQEQNPSVRFGSEQQRKEEGNFNGGESNLDGRGLTLVGGGLEQHLDELPVDDAVVHRQDVEPGLGVDHRHGARAEQEAQEPSHSQSFSLSSRSGRVGAG